MNNSPASSLYIAHSPGQDSRPGQPAPALTPLHTPAPLLIEGNKPDGISDKGRDIALARYELLRAWKIYCNTPFSPLERTHPLFPSREGTLKRNKTKATDDFLKVYNTGLSHPAIFKTLDKVSRVTLYRWEELIEDSTDWTLLVPQYHQNKNVSQRLNPLEAEVFMRFLLLPNKIRIGTATRLTKYALLQRGYKTDKSNMTFRRFAEDYIDKHLDTWVLMREGQKALKDKVAPYIQRDTSLLEVGDAVVADGHRLNFKVINPFTGKPCRATIVVGVDWKSWHPAGYEIMVEENTQCIASAQRNSILNLGKIMKVWYTDNGKAFKARFFKGSSSLEESGLYGLSARLSIIHIFAMPYNPRAKIVERWFKEFSNTFERLLPSYIGSSIEDKPAYMMRNEKFHKALHNEYVPTIEETVQLIEMWFDFHRSQECPHVKGKTIGEVFDAGKGPGVNIEDLDDLMMETKITRIDRNGIRFLNQNYYDDNLYGLREEVMIRYSLFDLSSVRIYSVKGEWICNAQRVMPVHPLARVLGTPKDVEALKRGIALQRSAEKKTLQGVRELVGMRKAAELDWQKVVEISPRIVEKLETSNIALPPVEKHIPEECVTQDSNDIPLEPSTAGILEPYREVPRLEPQTMPFFENNVDRYEWHLKYGMLKDEHRAWCAWFQTTDDFKMLYTYFENQQRAEQ